MKRIMMQAYLKGSNEAVPFYQKAFDAKLISSYLNRDGTYLHSELDIDGHILAVTENRVKATPNSGDVMQFCLHYGEGNEDKLKKAYEFLKEGATIYVPLAPCGFSSLMTDLVDKYGVRWCLFI